jgi:hypothetical protein
LVHSLCNKMRNQLISRGFYGWLSHCRNMHTVRSHLQVELIAKKAWVQCLCNTMRNQLVSWLDPPEKFSSAAGRTFRTTKEIKALTGKPCTVTRIPNIYSQNPNSTTSLPNTKFIFPKQIFIIPCGPSLKTRPKARVLALISIMPKLISVVYQQLDCQMHTAEQLLPCQAA